MKILYRLLMAGTVLSVASVQIAEAGIGNGASADGVSARPSVILLAQTEPDKKPEAPKKPAAQPQKPATPPPAAKPAQPPVQHAPPPPPVQRVAPPPPPPPVQHAPPPPPPVQRVAPPPPSVQHAPPPSAVPRKDAAPPALQQAPVRPAPPPAAQTPARPPASQIAPHAVPPAPQGRPPADAPRPVTPPPAATAPAQPPAPPTVQRAPNAAPPAVQGQPPAGLGRPLAPPAAQSTQPAAPGGTVAPAGAGIAPNMQKAPLQRSGVPAPTAQDTRPIAPAAAGAGIAPQSAQGKPLRRMDDLRTERRQTTEGTRTIIREPDRTIIREGGQTVIRHSEVDRFRYGARDVRLERRGNDNVTIVVRPDGGRVVTVLDQNGFLLRRSRIMPDGREIIIIDNRPRGAGFRPGGGYGGFFVNLAPPIIRMPRERYIVEDEQASPEILYDTLIAEPIVRIERPYSLDEIRYTAPLRDRMPRIDLNTINFDFGSWELSPSQVEKLAALAEALNRAIEHNPAEVFLIEGHTDAVGTDVDNLSLSDRRAESVAIALTQQFNVPPENLTTQGYGEQYLKIPTQAPERANRRVTVRRITPLLTGQAQ